MNERYDPRTGFGGQSYRQAGAELLPCGTRAAYERHRRNGEKACEECLRANAVAFRLRKALQTGKPVKRRSDRKWEDFDD